MIMKDAKGVNLKGIYMKYIKKINNKDLFILICFAYTALFFIWSVFFGPHMFDWLNMENNSTWTSLDHYLSIAMNQNLSKTYAETRTQYPPLASLLYGVFAKLLSVSGKDAEWYAAEEIAQYPYAQMLYVPYMCFMFLLFVYAISELNLDKKYKVSLVLVLLFSTPMFAGAMERGNLIMMAVGFMCIAYVWKDSSVKWKREAALVLIAVAAGIKIYPALMGLLYVKDKNWKDTIKLIIYGIICFFGPFIFFGKGSFMFFLNNLMATQIGGVYGWITYFQGLIVTFGVDAKVANYLNIVFALTLMSAFFLSKSKLRSWFYIASIMVLIPGNQFRYMLIVYLIPLFVLFTEDVKDFNKLEKWIDTILFAMIFSIPWPLGLLNHFSLNPGICRFVTYVDVFIYIPTYLMLIVQFSFDLYSAIKNHKTAFER